MLPARLKNQGVTFIELILVLAIVAILAALAYPSFASQLLKSQRLDAMQALYGLQLEQEEWRIAHADYANSVAQLSAGLSDHPHYVFSISGASASHYELTATARADSAQQNDSVGALACHTLTLTRNNQKTPAQCWE